MTKPAYRVVLFDLDGTLLDTNQLIVESFRHTFQEKLGRFVAPAELHPYFGEPLITTMERYAPEQAQDLVDFYRAFNVENHDRLIRHFPGMPEAVAQLAAGGVRLGIVTSKRTDTARRGLRVTGFEPHFRVVIGFDDTTKHKPEPDPALLALECMGEPPGPDVLMVGDSKFDILCGRNAGLRTAAVGWTVADRQLLDSEAKPHHWVESPAALVALAIGVG